MYLLFITYRDFSFRMNFWSVRVAAAASLWFHLHTEGCDISRRLDAIVKRNLGNRYISNIFIKNEIFS